MSDRFRVPITMPRKLEELGLSPLTVLRKAGLPMGLFSQERILVTTEEFFALYRAIADVSSDPGIGLKLGTEERIERYDPIAIAALCSRSLRDSLQRMARYKQLTCPEEIQLLDRSDECVVHFNWLLAQETEPSLLVDVCFAWIVSVARRGSGKLIQPKRIEFKRASENGSIYKAHFGCPVKFKASRNLLVFRKADTDGPFLTHNPDLLAMVAPQLEAELRHQVARKTVCEQVKGLVKRLLAGQRPSIQDIAHELHMSPRTLQRRLTEERLTFQQLLEDARRELAHHYLLHSSLELNETAYLLGYEDANSFFRAFHSWEGTSPGQWRSVQRASA